MSDARRAGARLMDFRLEPICREVAEDFVAARHYSAVMPRLTRHYLGCFKDDALVGALTLGWGTRPLHTIRRLFPTLSTENYLEIGKMCMDETMPRNCESQMLALSIRWLRENTDALFLFTWADGIVGKPGYVYQAANFLYGGFIVTDTYVTEHGEKVHPRTMQGLMANERETEYGSRPTREQLREHRISRVKGRQFQYIYPLTREAKKLLPTSTVSWGLKYPKHTDLVWSVRGPDEAEYRQTTEMPFTLTKHTEYNRKHGFRSKVVHEEDDLAWLTSGLDTE